MSRRGRRGRRQARRDRARWLAPLLAIVGAVLASLGAPRILDTLATPGAVDETDWILLVPGFDEQVQTPKLGRGSRVGMDALSLVPHSFGRSDRLLPRDPRPIARLEIELRPDSAPLGVNLAPGQGSQGGITTLMLQPDGWLDPSRSGVAIQPGSVAVLLHAGGVASALVGESRTPLVRQPEGSIELFAVDGPVHVRSVRAYDAQGASIVDSDWTTRAPSPLQRIAVALAGAGVGLLVGVSAAGANTVAGGLLSTLPLLLLPGLVLALPHAAWLAAVERLFLVKTTTWEVAGMALTATLLPLAGLALLRSRVLRVGRPSRRELPLALWVVGAVGVAAVGARGLHGWSMVWAAPGAVFLLAPLRLSEGATLSRGRLLARDAPAWIAVAALGWPVGLLPAALWRLVVVVAQTPTLLARAPRAGSDVLFLTLLAVPVGAEAALQASYLGEAWASERLSGASLGAGEDASGVIAYWSATCGDDPAEVWWFGGSSAGGAYQLGGQPEAFFPGQVHSALCEAGLSIRTTNFSNGGRDTFTFSRALDDLLAGGTPDLVVVYTGVNDILTANAPVTRAQREASAAQAGAAGGRLREVAQRSRLVAGLGLLARPVTRDASAFVSAVPVPDARDNLTRIADAVSASGGRVLLVPELTRPLIDDPLAPYRSMQVELAEQVAAVAYVDVVGDMRGADPEVVFVDRNHLSKAGHAQLAAHLAPAVTAQLAPVAP